MKTGFDLRNAVLMSLIYIMLWVLVAVEFAAMWYSFDMLKGHVWRQFDYLRWSLVEWSTLGILGPFALWFAGHNPIEYPHRLRRFALHFSASVGFAVLAIILGAIVSIFVEPGRPNISDQLEQFVTKHGEAGFLVYWVLVMVRQVTHLSRERTRRELHTTRLQAQLAESQLRVLKMQLHPHFLFNTLHAATTLISEDARAAEDMLLRLSELLRAYLGDDQQETSLADELERIELYLGIQRVRFKDRLDSRIEARADTMGCSVPSLILQPLVENAIQHGIGKNIGVDCIEIQSWIAGAVLNIDVRNRNSTLVPKPATSDEESGRVRIGLSNSRLRVQALYGDAASIDLENLQPRGVVCRIRLPLRRIDVTPVEAWSAA
jgi:two-component system, LytTR family, sensor kinase